MPKISVVIPSLPDKDLDYLKLCVRSLRATSDWDIIVVTNGTDVQPDLSDTYGITTHLHTRDQGQCRATNIGAKAVSPDTDYILVSNSDMYYAPNWKDNLRFEHPVFSPNLVEPVNNAGSAPPFLKEDGGLTIDVFNKGRVDGFTEDVTINGEAAPETGFNLPFFIRKDVWDTIGGYDENYDPWGSNSDTDLQTKIELAGIQPMRYQDMLVYHFSNKSGTFDGTHQDAWQKNWDYYKSKWGFTRDDEPIPDTWMARRMVNQEKNKFHPAWEGKYAKK